MKRRIVLIVHNIRSCHNVGSLLRTADGFGVENVYLTGYTPFPLTKNDQRLPHLARKIDRQIAKTSLGAEKSVRWHHSEDVLGVIEDLRSNGFEILALEQSPKSTKLKNYIPPGKVALIIGSEIGGVHNSVLALSDKVIEIPMRGQKESFNVSVAAAIALYNLRYS